MIGKENRVTIKSSKGKTTEYHQITFLSKEGGVKSVLLTGRELEAALNRAEKNTDSLRRCGFFSKVIAFFIRLVK